MHSYVSKHLLIVPTKHTMFILYIYLLYFPYMFGALCTIIRENHYAIYLKPYTVVKLLNMAPITIMP